MTLDTAASERAEFIPLLQPFVDGELGDEEQKRVAAEIAENPEFQAIVREQQDVRALLRSLEPEAAPAGLRARVLTGLDEVDEARASSEGVLAPIVGRIKAFGRGTMLMIPAAAAAVALFFGVRSGALDDLVVAGADGEHVDGGMANSMVGPGHRHADRHAGAQGKAGQGSDAAAQVAVAEPAESRGSDGPALAEVEEQGFAIQVAPSGSLPPGTALVSDGPSGPSSARVRYRDQDGVLIVNTQRHAASTRARGTRQVFRGETYHLERDLEGRARVEFVLGPVLHSLSLEGAKGRPGAPSSTDEQDFGRLLAVAAALRSTYAR